MLEPAAAPEGLTAADRKLVERLNQPAPNGAHAGVTRYLYELYCGREDLQRAFPDLSGDDANALVEWAHVHGRREVPIPVFLLPPTPAEFHRFTSEAPPPATKPAPAVGVNVAGFLNGELGLGEAARLMIAALDAAAVPVLPIEGSFRPNCRHEHDFKALPVRTPGFPLNLLCMNPPELKRLAEEVGPAFFSDRTSVGLWWWEVDGPIPFDWRMDLERIDEVWVGSAHVAECLAPLPMPVVRVPLPVQVPPPPPLTRAELGLPDGFLFMFLFDYHSTVQRKNPIAVIRAFEQEFAPGEGASLFIKSINSDSTPEAHARLSAAAHAHPDIHFVDAYTPASLKDAMIAACDCYVSLHRAEGFGLTTAEAMYLGKPVIATAYSGNLEYMTRHNSHLVRYEQVEVGSGAAPYPMTGVWADPDVGHAAQLMREVFDDPAAASRLGKRAAADIRRSHSPALAGASIRRELERLADESGQPGSSTPPPAAAARALIERGPVPPSHSALGALGPHARRLALRLMRPFSAYQQEVDRQLSAGLEAATEVATAGHAALERLRELELGLAHVQARELAALRERQRASEPPQPPPLAYSSNRNGRSSEPAMGKGRRDEHTAELQRLVDAVPFWWHSIDLGHGIVTPGVKGTDAGSDGRAFMAAELASLKLPELRDKTVLDIGAWDGYYSFEAERRGASRVVALDHYEWQVDRSGDGAAADALPGKRGFNIAHRALESGVEAFVADFMKVDLESLGTFDVVLFLGVLYHIENPLQALRRLSRVTRETAIIETEAIIVPGHESEALCEFFPFDELAGDHTNWWAPSLAALRGLLLAAGFAAVETVVGPPPLSPGPGPKARYRAVVHAIKRWPS